MTILFFMMASSHLITMFHQLLTSLPLSSLGLRTNRGFIIPCGTLIWTHTKRRQPSHPYTHFLFSGLVGVTLAIAGFAYGIAKFTTFSREGVSAFRMAHAVTGTIATIGAMIQTLLYAFMRKPRYPGEKPSDWPRWQKIGQFSHKYLGWVWLLFGLVACETGTHMTNVTHPDFLYLGWDHEDEIYTGGLIGALLATAVVTMTVVLGHNHYHDKLLEAKKDDEKDAKEVKIKDVPPADAFVLEKGAVPEKEIDLEDPMEDVELNDAAQEMARSQ
mmetsp:Transcript_25241/g.53014  ORF Transcript_25241/g.53014 Transcript_25241/m.53014 type:complete len:273 (+) Transcript_25241:254-1072(+)